MIKRILPKSEFAKNVLTLMTGSTLAQLIPILISPILTRIYSPDDFGIFALFLSTTAILGLVASGRYELAIMLPKRKKDAEHLLVASLIIVALTSLITFLIIFLFNGFIVDIFAVKDFSKWLYLVPLAILFVGVFNSLNYWINRNKNYKELASSRVIQNGATAITNLSLGFNNFGTAGLVYGNLVGRGAAAFFLSLVTIKKDNIFKKNFNPLRIIALLKKHKDFPKINLPHSMFNSISSELPIFLISYFFQSTITGFYSFANRVLLSPINIVTRSYGQVFFQKLSHLRSHNENAYSFFRKTVFSLLLYTFPFFLVLFLYAQELFSFVFGSEWLITGVYAQILTPMLFVRFTGTIVSCVVVIYDEQKKAFFIEIINSILRFMALVIGGLSGNIILGLILFSGFSFLITSYRLSWYLQIVKGKK